MSELPEKCLHIFTYSSAYSILVALPGALREKINDLENEIEFTKSRIREAEAYSESASTRLDLDDWQYWRIEELQLRTKGDLLRTKSSS